LFKKKRVGCYLLYCFDELTALFDGSIEEEKLKSTMYKKNNEQQSTIHTFLLIKICKYL